MKKDIKSLVRPSIETLLPYSSARDEYTGEKALFLDANENPFNAPYNRYPDPRQVSLKEKIGRLKDIDAAKLFVGNGSDEAIDLLFRVFCEPAKDNVVSMYPTYGMYEVCADINNVEFRKVMLKEDFSIDQQAMIEACDEHTKLLFLCSPNNPTSNSIDPEVILSLLKNLNVIVVLDEAYIDFSTRESLKAQVARHPNLVVLQTFSKAWGLAGIRLGIAIADPQLIYYMNKVKYPYNLNMLTINFALQALEEEHKVKSWVQTILAERSRMEKKLKKYRFVERVFPSDANFLLVQVRKPKKVYTYLVEKKIIVRDRSNVSLCEGSLRITTGTQEENDRLMDALMQYQRDFVDSCEL